MSVKITPEQLADIESKANATLSRPGTWGFQGASAIHAFQSAANPAVVLAMSKEIKRLWAAQCWVIVDEDGNTVNGPWFTEAEAIEDLNIYEHEPGHFDKFMTYRVARWKGGAE